MNLGNFARSTLFYMGLNAINKRDSDLQQANLDIKQQEAAKLKMENMAFQQRQETAKQVGQMISQEQANDKDLATDPQRMAALYQKAEAKALEAGDFQGADEFDKMAKNKLQEAVEQQTLVAKKVQAAKEDFAGTADKFLDNPTPEGLQELKVKAVQAGINPAEIPAVNDPRFPQWVQKQRLAAMSTEKRTEYIQKEREIQEKREESKREFEAKLAETRSRDRQTAAYQNGLLQIHRAQLAAAAEARRERALDRAVKAPVTKEFEGRSYEWDPTGRVKGNRDRPDKGWVQVSGEKQTAAQRSAVTAIVGSAGEAVRGLRVIAAMPAGQSAGAFQGLKDGTIPQALGKVGTNKLTPQSMQMYQTASTGLGLELGRILTLGGGRGVNQAQIHELQNMTQVRAGDTEFEAMFKFANAADMVRNRMTTLQRSGDPKIAAEQDRILKDLSRIPTPEKVLEIANKKGQGTKLLKKYGNMQNAMDKLTAPGATLTHEDNALINKYLNR